MHGTIGTDCGFSELFIDTIGEHGMSFAFDYYVNRHKMSRKEFRLWCRICFL